MKYLLFLSLAFLITKSVVAQSLEGEWYGGFKYRYEAVSIPWTPMALKFSLNNDSTYTVRSFTQYGYYKKKKLYFDTTICLVSVVRLTSDSIFLEERKVLSPKADTNTCFQRMYLKIIHNQDDWILSGTWDDVDKTCTGSGNISFTRRKNE